MNTKEVERNNVYDEYVNNLKNYIKELQTIGDKINNHIFTINKSPELAKLAYQIKDIGLKANHYCKFDQCDAVTNTGLDLSPDTNTDKIYNPMNMFEIKWGKFFTPSNSLAQKSNCFVDIEDANYLFTVADWNGTQNDASYIKQQFEKAPLKNHKDLLYTYIRNGSKRKISLTNPIIVTMMIHQMINIMKAVISDLVIEEMKPSWENDY